MRILQISNFFKPFWETGGVTKVGYEISCNLVKIGHEVTVYTTDGYNPEFQIEVNEPVDVDGTRVYYFKNLFKNVVRRANLTFPYYLPFVLRKEIREFDIIHIHEHRTLSAAIVHYYAKKHRIPYVLQSHGSVLPFFQKNTLKKIFDWFFGYNILKDASKLIALTETEANQYIQMGVDESKIVIIPNGINTEEVWNLPCKGEFKKRYSINAEEKIILYLGRINKIKGIDLLIDAYSELVPKLGDTRLVIVGPNGDYSVALKEQTMGLGIDEKVLLTGPLYGRDKLEAYVDADIYVLPSRYETFPNTVLEAAACGSPVIITENCGIADIVRGKIGLVVEFNKNQLSEAIFNLLVYENNGNDFENKNRKSVINEFDWTNVIQRIEQTYIDVCKNQIK